MDSTQQTALEQASVRVVYFVEFYFASGTIYLCSASQPITIMGHTYTGVGSLGTISSVEESSGMEARALSFTLNCSQTSWISLAIGDVEEYRGRAAKMYFVPLDSGFVPIGTPELCWRGIMDTMAMGIEGDSGSIILKCESTAYALKRKATLRLNPAQHKRQYPSDTGFDYLTDLIANPQLWLSKKFQER